MGSMLLTNEALARFGSFAAVLVIMALLEIVVPRRQLIYSKWRRWATNLTIIGFGYLMVRALALLAAALAVPLVAWAAAEFAAARGWGAFNLLAWPGWLEVTLAVIILDFAIWLQHVASHKVPLLWRLHQVHHADVDIDVTTALRFHPVEIGLSMLYKVVWVLVLGAAPLAVLVFEIVLNACAMFSHSNVKLPAVLDSIMRSLIVTPDMHRVHHSILRREHDSNYGFNLSIWDRLFATYTAQPEAGHEGMRIGLTPYQNTEPTKAGWSLALPFKRSAR